MPIGDVCGVEVEEDQINQEFPPLGDPINCVPPHTDIRVLFLFSPAAFARIPSLAAFANGIIGELNTSSMASGLSPTEVSFVSAGVFVLPGFIEDPCSGKTKKALLANQAAKTLRAIFFADIVCMIINDVHGPNPPCDASGNAVNNASADEAYCFAEITTALRQFKATHGIGHVIGLGHQRCSNCWNPRCVFNGGSGYARGFRINSTSRTIMADCDGTTRVPRWSADGVPFGGFTTGDEDNDNARKLREKANKVSCFQPDPPLPPQPVTIIGPTTICGGGTRTYTVAGTGSLSQANWSMKTDITLWESVGTGETATITAPTDAKIITLRVTVPGGGSATITIKVVGCRNNNTVENRMDIKPEIEVENLVNVFPNPANDKITITGLQYKNKVTLYDMQGQTIVEKKGAETTFVDIQTLPSGVYMLSISGTTTVKYFKIIKQ